jgi:hypothetical protein
MECKKGSLLIITLIASSTLINANTEPDRKYFFTLDLLTESLVDEAYLIRQYLQEIGIKHI